MSNDVSLVEQGDFLLARVAEVKHYGAVLNLIEYEGEKGFVHISEVTSGWIKYIRDFIREGQMVVCKVLKSKAEAKRGMIDLSIRQVSGHKKKAKIRAWKNEQKASKLFEILSDSLGMENADSSDVIINLKNEYSSLYLAFEYAISDEDDFRKNNEGPWVDSLINSAKNNIVAPFVNIEGILTLNTEEPEGILIIKETLSLPTPKYKDSKIDITTDGAPNYRVKITSADYRQAEEELKDSIDTMINYIESKGGQGSFARA